MSDQELYEFFKPRVKARDAKCTEPGCTFKGDLKFLKVVRIDPTEPDSMENLRLVCKQHTLEFES